MIILGKSIYYSFRKVNVYELVSKPLTGQREEMCLQTIDILFVLRN